MCFREIDDRYCSVCEVAKTRSIISLGLSCFKRQHESDSDGKFKETNTSTFLVQTFNIFVLCSETYVVEPLALQFLVSHGFDFNRQYAQGLPYTRGNDPVSIQTDFFYTVLLILLQSKGSVIFIFLCFGRERERKRMRWHLSGLR